MFKQITSQLSRRHVYIRYGVVRVCLAEISLLSVIEYLNIKQLWRKISYMKISDNTVLHFLCSCSFLITFLLSYQFYWHIRLKSTAYFFDPPCIYVSVSLFRAPLCISHESFRLTARFVLVRHFCDKAQLNWKCRPFTSLLQWQMQSFACKDSRLSASHDHTFTNASRYCR